MLQESLAKAPAVLTPPDPSQGCVGALVAPQEVGWAWSAAAQLAGGLGVLSARSTFHIHS